MLGPLEWAIVKRIQMPLDHKPITIELPELPYKERYYKVKPIGWKVESLTDG